MTLSLRSPTFAIEWRVSCLLCPFVASLLFSLATTSHSLILSPYSRLLSRLVALSAALLRLESTRAEFSSPVVSLRLSLAPSPELACCRRTRPPLLCTPHALCQSFAAAAIQVVPHKQIVNRTPEDTFSLVADGGACEFMEREPRSRPLSICIRVKAKRPVDVHVRMATKNKEPQTWEVEKAFSPIPITHTQSIYSTLCARLCIKSPGAASST